MEHRVLEIRGMGLMDCEICMVLWTEAFRAIRSHLEAISAVEDAVAQKQVESVSALERTLFETREHSARAMREYREHRFQSHGENRTMTAGMEP
jgi:hypothetical protein